MALGNGASFTGGTLNNSGLLDVTGAAALGNIAVTGGQLTIESGQTASFEGVNLTNVAVTDSGTIAVGAGQTLTFETGNSLTSTGGNLLFDNSGQIILTGTVTGAATSATFEGGGTDTRDGGGLSLGATLVTNVDNTFDGFGSQGLANATLMNEAQATVDADASGKIYALTYGTIANAGTLEATNGGTLELENGSTTSTGNIKALAGSEVLLSGESVSGQAVTIAAASGQTAAGQLVAAGTSAIENGTIGGGGGVALNSGATLTLDGTTVTGTAITSLSTLGTTPATGTVNVDSGKTLTLAGTDTFTGGTLTFEVALPRRPKIIPCCSRRFRSTI